MKKILKYKGIEFDSYALFDKDDLDLVFDDASEDFTLDSVDFGEAYVCPHCIKKNNLYKETYTTESMLNEVENTGYICCVRGCNNMDAYSITMQVENCELVDKNN